MAGRKPTPPTSDYDIEAAFRLFCAGRSVRDIAAEIGCSKTLVGKWRVENGWEARRAKWLDEELAAAAKGPKPTNREERKAMLEARGDELLAMMQAPSSYPTVNDGALALWRLVNMFGRIGAIDAEVTDAPDMPVEAPDGSIVRKRKVSQAVN